MSAWLVSKAHIDTLVQASVVAGLVPFDEASAFGRDLWLENHRSLNARYGDPIPGTIDYTFTGIEAPLDPKVVRAAIASWDYQSCEHGTPFLCSEAYATMKALNELLDDASEWDGGRGWNITNIEDAVLTSEVTP